tara:strand:- start:4641 stop:4898 length:258 start_codon:yes stop_codon:yes gene_type:complete
MTIEYSLQNHSSADPENTEADLGCDAMACNGLSDHTNQEAQHGNASIQALGPPQALTLDLSSSLLGHLLPYGRRRHRSSENISKY